MHGAADKKPWDKKLRTDWSKHSNVKSSLPQSTVNYHYHLYKLYSPSSNLGPANKALPSITILSRHHLHGLSLENTTGTKGRNFKSSAYVVYPKLENQVFFGCEVNTHTEILEQWSELLLRPNTTLLQTRACIVSGDVIVTEERDMQEVLRVGRQANIKFQPGAALASLYVILNTLQKLPVGKYLLHHHHKSEAFIRLMRCIEEDKYSAGHQTVFNLHESYGFTASLASELEESAIYVLKSPKYCTPPWLPIDTHVTTPFHLKHRKIPATFPMNNPDKKLTNKQKKFIKARAKNKKSIYDTPTEASNATKAQNNKRDDIY